MAVGLLRKRLEEDGYDDVTVESAGIYGLHQSPATPYAQQVMNDRHIDISQHRSRQLTRDMVEQADVVLVMEQNHRWFIHSQAKELRDKVWMMSELVEAQYDIRDPYQGSWQEYEYIAQELEGMIQSGFPVLLEWLYEDRESTS